MGNSYIKSGYAAKKNEDKIRNFEKSIEYTKQALKYKFNGPYNCINLSSAIVNLIDLGNRQEQITKYQKEIEYFSKIILGFDKIDKENITVYNNAYCVYQRTSDKKNLLKYLEKCLEANKSVKEYKKEYFTEDKDNDFIKDEPKYLELIEKYFPDKKKAKQKKEKSETKKEAPVNTEIEQFVKKLKNDFNLTILLTKDEKDVEIEFEGDAYDKYYTPEIKAFVNENTQQIVEYLISKKDEYKKILSKLGKINNVKISKSSCQIDKDGSLWGLLLENSNLTDLSPLLEFPDILSIDLSNNKLINFQGLQNLKSLVRLTARRNDINDISVLENLTKLREINLEYNKLTKIDVFRNLVNLKNIQISENEISDISSLVNASKLESFWASFNKIEDISPLKNAEKLNYLNIWNNPVENIEALKGKQLLRMCYINKTNVKDISPLKGLEKLEYLNISENEIDDLKPLIDIPNLRELILDETIIADYSPLLELSNLKSLTISESVIKKFPEIKTYLKKMGCNISERD